MNTNFQWANVDQDIEESLKIIKDYDVYELPILENGILKGIITMDDATDALIDVAEEDYAKFAGLTEEEETNESVFKSIKKRLPWLSILLILDIFVTIIISQFEYLFTIDSMTILVIFQPMILGLAGNCGTQSLAVTIRKISNYQLDHKKPILSHIGRELSLGFITGLVLAITSFILTLLVLLLKQNNNQNIFVLATVVSIALFVSIVVANTVGSLIPIILNKCGVDPAVASGPFITTINDISSITIYFTLATLLIYNFL
jgi:magnesium transporter